VKANSVRVIQTALRLLKHGEDYRVLVHPDIDVDGAIADLARHYDENGKSIAASQFVECPSCFGEVEVKP
jgi:hypothetical protein